MGKYMEPTTEYWQVRNTGEIMEVSAADERSELWHKAYRHVRLFHHAESGCVLVEDYHAPAHVLMSYHESQCDEVDLATFNYWKLIYDNPDL